MFYVDFEKILLLFSDFVLNFMNLKLFKRLMEFLSVWNIVYYL